MIPYDSMIPDRTSSPSQAESENQLVSESFSSGLLDNLWSLPDTNPLASWHSHQALTPACRDETKGGGGERPLRPMTKISAEKSDELSLFTRLVDRPSLGMEYRIEWEW